MLASVKENNETYTHMKSLSDLAAKCTENCNNLIAIKDALLQIPKVETANLLPTLTLTNPNPNPNPNLLPRSPRSNKKQKKTQQMSAAKLLHPNHNFSKPQTWWNKCR